jgi:hypothetical protein
VCEAIKRLFDLYFVVIILIVALLAPIHNFVVILVSNLVPRTNNFPIAMWSWSN